MRQGERAAIQFVRDLIPTRALMLIEGPRHPAYNRVLIACRRELRLPTSDSTLAVKRLIDAFPQDQRHDLTQLLFTVLDLQFDQRRIRQRAAFRVGVVVGRTQSDTTRRKGGTR